jgi:hypothetical protein
MKRFWGLCALGALLCGAGVARADTQQFEALAQGAVEVHSKAALAAILWPHVGSCDRIDNDLQRRQCEGVRRARGAQAAGVTYMVKGDAKALEIGDWDADKKSVSLSVRACVACVAPLSFEGGVRFVVGGRGAPQAAGGAVRGPELYSSARVFKSAADAARWKEDVVPRLRTELLVRVPARPPAWKAGEAEGYTVEIVGFRVYDRCDGAIVSASHAAQPASPDREACSGDVEPDEEVVATPTAPAKPATPRLPARLGTSDINRALAPARAAAQNCFQTFGVPGNASFRITITNEGEVVELSQSGDFTDTPTGACLDKAVRATTFPASRAPRTTFDFPFMLR